MFWLERHRLVVTLLSLMLLAPSTVLAEATDEGSGIDEEAEVRAEAGHDELEEADSNAETDASDEFDGSDEANLEPKDEDVEDAGNGTDHASEEAEEQAVVPEPVQDEEAAIADDDRFVEAAPEPEPMVLAPPRLVALEEAPSPPKVVVTPRLGYRVWADTADQGPFEGGEAVTGLYQRLRLGLGIDVYDFGVRTEIDAFTGRLIGESPTLPSQVDPGSMPLEGIGQSQRTIVDPRALYGLWRSPVGQLQIGLQPSQWGLGLLANNGASRDDGLFNQSYGGDRSFRALFATAPLRPLSPDTWLADVYVAVGGDAVYRDENASYEAGDRAYQGVASVFYNQGQTTVGAYSALRAQTDRNGDRLDVVAFDLYGDHTFYSPEAHWALRLAAESALLTGSTTRVDTFEPGEPMGLRALGVATEVEVRHRPSLVGFKILSGYASGDASNDDDTLYRFRFDPNYKVGLVLFDQYLPAMSRESLRRIGDPERVGRAPRGSEGLLETGAVANALYLNPQLVYGGAEGLMAGVGVVWARADVPVTDPYNSFVNGGLPAGPLGARPASRDLGWELDLAARYRLFFTDDLAMELNGEYGIFFPGEAFADETGTRDSAQTLIRLRLALIW
jgi:hypothetical protein